ncbi:MAG: hypothetical protein K9H48_07920 [Melioribacteraceae bacterium]|nr:hypothetical protein [Melioribacteraceae bacterium]
MPKEKIEKTAREAFEVLLDRFLKVCKNNLDEISLFDLRLSGITKDEKQEIEFYVEFVPENIENIEGFVKSK